MSKCYAKDLVRVADAEVGYLEKETNANLDDKTKNAGDENYTKYGKARGCNGQYWCDAFVDEVFVQAFGEEQAKKLLNGFSNYTPTSAQYFKAIKQYYYKNPVVGDVIFFRNSERICHTGIVYKVDSKKVYTIEGNTSSGPDVARNGGGVFRKEYDLTNPKIDGYGRPKYDQEEPVKTKVESEEGCIYVKLQDSDNVLNCREKPNANKTTKILGTFKDNKKLILEEKTTKEWYKVTATCEEGKRITGYVSAKYTSSSRIVALEN